MKRKSRRMAAQNNTETAGALSPMGDSFGFHERRYSNSADIAIERPVSSYPMSKKTEGKILRPQYKDILRDPANALHLISHPSIPANASPRKHQPIAKTIYLAQSKPKFCSFFQSDIQSPMSHLTLD